MPHGTEGQTGLIEKRNGKSALPVVKLGRRGGIESTLKFLGGVTVHSWRAYKDALTFAQSFIDNVKLLARPSAENGEAWRKNFYVKDPRRTTQTPNRSLCGE